ncbi:MULTISPECIES: bifunctional hydroxymethylpyrimidine kinase/phosphomethylpyrimidine kinase [unclassified Meiothermus]|uniref:bifunctional hydroxymethylpyrimidine kinase/phosphomethylpyrimidine kinase n=1 Tax=unclassified Meiothermus TaxID=370471 RepID=UPI000D7D1C21|nr:MULTISPECIES: bifunctional hydroxymethylpyrimidine kinase/phosphomethylpyrimidine kinase [unclassified Meiothermus]PZA08447.1 bifunctional hydroxymethylpyrimidine kinase/phosphomethylpyrimidine kinase [Meiothermus sp. Pnk-1]RYM31374.1 bifunctional hydroxymethylpyrimidine kinase/phosphomethylpyrimidine kinase [Meiothermus sp. PNK-Is4]
MPFPIALTIAGSDPSGGAGLQADLKTFHRFGVYGMGVVSLLTVQNTLGVQEVVPLEPALVARQLEAVLHDPGAHALKTGALGDAAIVHSIAPLLAQAALPLVVDPVLVAKSGDSLLSAQALEALKADLLPLATLLTPNRLEAQALLGQPIRDLADAREAAQLLGSLGPRAVLLKGGHLPAEEATDVLWDGQALHLFPARKIPSAHTHGTGCTLSAAITALLAKGIPLYEAVARAKRYVSQAITTAPGIGRGIGPLNHWAEADG